MTLDLRRSRRPIAVSAVAVIAIALFGPLAAALVAGAGALGVATARRRRAARRRAARRLALPAALDLLVVAVHAGLTPHQAIDVIARHGPDDLRDVFETVTRRTARGEPLADALRALPDSIGPAAVAATDALAMAQRHGVPLHDAMIVIAAEATRQRRLHAQQAARRLPVLLSFPLVTCILPAFVLLAIAPAVIAALGSFDQPTW